MKKNIGLLINYNDIDTDIENKLNSFNYYIYASKNTHINSDIFDKKNNYLVSNDFYQDNKEIIDEKIKNKENIIIESFEAIVTDRMIAEK